MRWSLLGDLPLVSVTVAVRDGENWVDDCLQSLVDQTHRPLEIIAVNDGSTDGTAERLEEWSDESGEANGVSIRILNQEALGLAAARQYALEESRGEWVAITDIDCRPYPTWIEFLLAQSDGLDDENVVSVTGRVIFDEGDTIVSRIRAQEIERKYRKRSRRTTLANGPCSMFLREKLLDIGGFNPSWYHAEDMEVSLKLVELGGVIIHTPDALVQHVPEDRLKLFLRKRKRDARAHMRIVRKYSPALRKGPGFDFIGASWFVLALAPFLFGTFFFLARIIFTDVRFEFNALGSQILISLSSIYVLLGLSLMKGFLGRGRITTKIKDSLLLPFVLTLWSISLWLGITIGAIDALTGRHGHGSE